MKDSQMRSSPTAYLLWFGCLIGFAGLHRFYLGRPWSGLLWLLTFGLLGIGQLVDLFLIPGMVREGAFEHRLSAVERQRRLG